MLDQLDTPDALIRSLYDWPERFSETLLYIQRNPLMVYENAEDYLAALIPVLNITWEVLYVQQKNENNKAITTFYDTLFRILRRCGARFMCGSQHRNFPLLPINERTVTLFYHTNAYAPQIWNYKEAYLPDYVHFDKRGYAGWSELAVDPKAHLQAQNIDQDTADAFFETIQRKYINNNLSKYAQEVVRPDLPDDFIFVPMQLVHDKTQELARIRTLELAKLCVEFFSSKGKALVIKRHPLCNDEGVARFLSEISETSGVFISQSSVHHLIHKCHSVVTVNSGVGFEALLHLKPVFVSGKCDYEAVCTEIHTASDLDKVLYSKAPEHADIKRFLYLMLQIFQCRSDDERHVAMHLLRTLFINSERKVNG